MKIKKICKQCGKEFESRELNNFNITQVYNKAFGFCSKCKTKKAKTVTLKLFENDEYLFRYFKGRLFKKIYPTILDNEIIRSRIRLFKIQREALSVSKEVNHESN